MFLNILVKPSDQGITIPLFNFIDEIDKMLSVIHKVYPDISNINICTPLMTFPLLKLSHYMKKWPIEAKDSDYPSKFHLMADTLEVK